MYVSFAIFRNLRIHSKLLISYFNKDFLKVTKSTSEGGRGIQKSNWNEREELEKQREFKFRKASSGSDEN